MTIIQRRFNERARQFRVALGGNSSSVGKSLRFGYQASVRAEIYPLADRTG